MTKTLLVAKRDFLQTVQSSTYLLGLLFLPVLFGIGYLVTPVLSRLNDVTERRAVVIDRTGGSAAEVLQEANLYAAAAEHRTGLVRVPGIRFEEVNPASDNAQQLLDLSDRVRKGELYMVVELRRDDGPGPGNASRYAVRYFMKSPGIFDQVRVWLPQAVNDGLRRVRLNELGIPPEHASQVLADVPVVLTGLLQRDPATGRTVEVGHTDGMNSTLVSVAIALLLVMLAMAGAVPHLSGVAEDKMQRVHEMLLSSATPLQLMGGKVLAAVASSVTSFVVYTIGGLLALKYFDMFGMAPLSLLPWFFLYLIADVAMLSATAVALGAASSTAQDVQQLAGIVFAPLFLPMFIAPSVIQQPNGVVPTAISLIPPLTPVLMLLRQGLPDGVPWWQPWFGLGGVVLWTILVTWAGARIFRIGILSQGKTPSLGELAQWIVRG